MAFWNVTGGAQVTTFDANGFAVGTDVDQGSIRAMSTGTVFGANPKFTNVPLGEDNPVITIVSGIDAQGNYEVSPASNTQAVHSVPFRTNLSGGNISTNYNYLGYNVVGQESLAIGSADSYIIDGVIGYNSTTERYEIKIDTDNVPCTTRAIEVINAFRKDERMNYGDTEEILDLAPSRENQFFKVPKIISD